MGTTEQGLTPNLPLMTQGVVPYLGTFLTDLGMLDTAMEDYLEVGEPEAWGGGTRVLRIGSRESLDWALSSVSLGILPSRQPHSCPWELGSLAHLRAEGRASAPRHGCPRLVKPQRILKVKLRALCVKGPQLVPSELACPGE